MNSMPAFSDSTTTPLSSANALVRLTQQVKAGGCASKLAPGILNEVLSKLPTQHDGNLLVGFATADDAGVYRISDHQALVQTVDFFTPMIDDPYTFGQIAATNALSDVYAMGGQALTALSIVCFPQGQDPAVLQEIMRGGLSVMQDASCIVVGGHSVRDPEIKFGYAVTGLIDPRSILKNCTAQVGDSLVLAKAIGTGVITTALKHGRAENAWISAAISSMIQSNRVASEIARRADFNVHAMTDVTGFGLLGHAREMALGSGVRLTVETRRVPLLEGALATVEMGCVPAGAHSNRQFAECIVSEDPGAHVDETLRTLLYDPQTSGGLLIAVPRSHAGSLVVELRASGYPAAEIGRVIEGDSKIILH
jgi:selenide,water dikinase